MRSLVMVFGILGVTILYANSIESIFDKNINTLKQCQLFFEKKDGITTISLLDNKTMRLPDLYTKDNQDEPYLISQVVDCFDKEKFLVQSDLVIEDQYYFLINLRDGTRTPIDGMTYLSSDRKHFVTNYYGMDESRVSLYSLNKNEIKRVFTIKFNENECYTKNIKWVSKQKVAFDFMCSSEKNFTKSFMLIQQKNKRWKLIGE